MADPPRQTAVRPARRVPFTEALRYVYLRRVVGTALHAVGFDMALLLARALARGIYDLHGPARRRSEQRIAAAHAALAVPPGEPAELVRVCYENIAAFWIETLFFRRRLRPSNWPCRVRIAGEHELLDVCRGSSPAIFVTGYLGHPGVGAFVLGQLCRPVHVLVDVLAQPVLRTWQADMYGQPNVRLIGRHESLTKLPAVLESGGKIMLIGEAFRAEPTSDIRTRRAKGDPVRFLGRPRRAYQTVRLLGRRYHAPVIPFACTRDSYGFEFTLRLGRRIEPAAPDVSQRMIASLESFILTHPTQYLWTLADTNEAPRSS
jgi:lauroyl/myristoyl acyltransferase